MSTMRACGSKPPLRPSAYFKVPALTIPCRAPTEPRLPIPRGLPSSLPSTLSRSLPFSSMTNRGRRSRNSGSMYLSHRSSGSRMWPSASTTLYARVIGSLRRQIEPQQYYRSPANRGECQRAGPPPRWVSRRADVSLQLHHAHPEHGLAADVDVVLAYEGELAVVADAEDRQTGGDGPDRVAVSHVHRKIVLGHEHASTWIDVKRARMDGARLDVLDRSRLAGRLVDRVHHDAVLAALEHLLALEIHGVLSPIRPVQKTAVRMHVDGARRLTRSAVLRLRQRVRAERDVRIDPAAFHLVRVHLVLSLDRDVHPGLRGMKIEMPRPEVLASVGCDRHRVGQHTVRVVEGFERPGVFGLGRGAFVAARDQNGQPVVGGDAHLVR